MWNFLFTFSHSGVIHWGGLWAYFSSPECFPFIHVLLKIDTALLDTGVHYDAGLSIHNILPIHNILSLGTRSPCSTTLVTPNAITNTDFDVNAAAWGCLTGHAWSSISRLCFFPSLFLSSNSAALTLMYRKYLMAHNGATCSTSKSYREEGDHIPTSLANSRHFFWLCCSGLICPWTNHHERGICQPRKPVKTYF